MPNFEAIYPFSQPLPMSNFKCCPCSRKEIGGSLSQSR